MMGTFHMNRITHRIAISVSVAGLLVAALSVAAMQAAGVSLIDAVKHGDQAALRSLLAGRPDVNVPEADGMTALHWAVYGDDADMVQLLLTAGANPKAMSRYGITPLSLASESGNAAIADRLLQAGADPNAAMSGSTALHVAARSGKLEVAKVLVAHGANVSPKEEWFLETPLMLAAAENHPEMVKYLIEAGADVNAVTTISQLQVPPGYPNTTYAQIPKGGLTALSIAARDGCLGCVRALVEAGANINYEDPARATPLNLAVYNAHWDTAALLLGLGANPNDESLYVAVDMHNLILNPVNEGGSSPTRPVPRPNDKLDSVDLVKLLLAKGANPNDELMKDLQSRNLSFGGWRPPPGLTPLQRAASVADLELMQCSSMAAPIRIGAATGTTPRCSRPCAPVLNVSLATRRTRRATAWDSPIDRGIPATCSKR